MTTLMLVDSSFLRVLYDAKHPKYPQVHAAATLTGASLVIPEVVLTETTYLFRRDGGVMAVVRFLDTLRLTQP